MQPDDPARDRPLHIEAARAAAPGERPTPRPEARVTSATEGADALPPMQHGAIDVGAATDIGGTAPHDRASYSDPLPTGEAIPGAGSPDWMERPVDRG